jgi:hypothetical protein
MHPGSNRGLPRASSRLFTRAAGRVAYWVSCAFALASSPICFFFLTNCMCIAPRGARPKKKKKARSSKRVWRSLGEASQLLLLPTIYQINGLQCCKSGKGWQLLEALAVLMSEVCSATSASRSGNCCSSGHLLSSSVCSDV